MQRDILLLTEMIDAMEIEELVTPLREVTAQQ
jgi:hypothetical protein